MPRAALVQLTSSDDPEANLPVTRGLVAEGAAEGAGLILTPEVTNCVSASRTRRREVLRAEAEDPTLAALRDDAARLGVWLVIGSLALATDDPEGRFANRSFLIGPDGAVAGEAPGVTMVELDLAAVAEARRRVPSLDHDRPYASP